MKVAIVGTSGRKLDAPLVTLATFTAVLDRCRQETTAQDTLVSGGAAFADHAAVVLALERAQPLMLELPAPWDAKAKRYDERSEAGRISNHYHRAFSKACGWIEAQSLIELDVALRQASTEVVVVAGFFARNSLIAERCDRLLAFTFHEPGASGPSGGTGNTWRQCRKPKQCIVIPSAPKEPESNANPSADPSALAALEVAWTLDDWPPPSAELMRRVDHEYATSTVYPPRDELFAALQLCPLRAVRVVILGQDCYHGPGQAHGLAFSVKQGRAPPSLINIFQEIKSDLGRERTEANLADWAAQGVLLLNAMLSVRARSAASHAHLGWEAYTDQLIALVSERCAAAVFLLWGNFAQRKRRLIDKRHLVLTAAHPSPLSAAAGFFGCKHFSKANAWLAEHGQTPINW